MSLTDHFERLDNDRLRAALADASAYLKLMPRAPVTTSKIVELESVLNQKQTIGLIEEDKVWKVERYTPAGKALKISFSEGSLRFESEIPWREGSGFGYDLSVAEIDSLIDSLVTRRINIAQG